MDMDPKHPSCMGQEEKRGVWKARALKEKSKKGKKIPYLPPRCKPFCGQCGFGMMMFLLSSVVKKLGVVSAKQKEDGDRLREIQEVLRKGRRDRKYKFHGPITGLQICTDGTNNFTMHSSGRKRKRHKNFQPGANAETANFKTSPPMVENDQADNDIRTTDCDFDKSVKGDERCNMNLDNCLDSFGDDDPDVCCYATQGYQHDQDCQDAAHGIDADLDDGRCYTKQDLWNIDDGGNVLGLSNLSGTDLSDVDTSSHASDDSDQTNISESSCSNEDTAIETFPELDDTSDICMQTSEKLDLSVKVSSECVDSKSRPVGGTSLRLSGEPRADVDPKTGVETESDVNTSSQACTASGTHATSGANLKNALSVQGRKWPTRFDPPFAVPQTNDAYDDQTSPGKGRCVIQSGDTIFKGWIDGHAGLMDSPRQWSERSLSSGPVVQTDDIQRARGSPYAMDPHCVQTGNSMEDPERPLPSIAPYNVKTVQGMLESGEPVLATVVAETDNGIKGPISATSSDYVNGILSDSSKPDEKYANDCSPGVKELVESNGIALPVSSEADDGVKGSTFVPSFDRGMVSDGREGVEGADHFTSGDLLKAGSEIKPTKGVPSISLFDDAKAGTDTKQYKEPVSATLSDIVKDDRDMNEREEFGSVAFCSTTKPDSGMKLACEDPSCASFAGFVKAGNGSKKHHRCMSATVSHTVSAEKNKKESERFLSALNIRCAQDGEGASGMKRSLSANCLDSSQIGLENQGLEPFQARVPGNVGAGTRNCVLASERSLTTISVGPDDSISGKDCQVSQLVTLPYPVQSAGDVAGMSEESVTAAPVLDSA